MRVDYDTSNGTSTNTQNNRLDWLSTLYHANYISSLWTDSCWFDDVGVKSHRDNEGDSEDKLVDDSEYLDNFLNKFKRRDEK